MKSLFIFRRDLRLHDNTALLTALKQSDSVLPVFCLTKTQLVDNKYKSDNAVEFMCNSLKELDQKLKKHNSKLHFFEGNPKDLITKTKGQFGAIFINKDYTPFSIKRDQEIKKTCQDQNIKCFEMPDYLLTEPNEIKTKVGTPYTVYSHFYNNAKHKIIPKDRKNIYSNYTTSTLKVFKDISILNKYQKTLNKNIFKKGGRKEALTILKNIKSKQHYVDTRNIPSVQGTTGLSAHLKFGTVSIREAYHKIANTLGKDSQLIKELFWRDFFSHISFHFPKVFGEEFQKKYKGLGWNYNKKLFKAWCEGNTGFPIVDAGMRQLNTTGWMHNRVRMIVASFLTKDLHIDWRMGEQYFAQKLVDYDPSINNGNWQWAASTGCDAQPYFRIFNPWSQQERFDPECKYIKTWVPELEHYTAKEIHNWQGDENYPAPIIDHKVEREITLQIFKNKRNNQTTLK